MGLIKWGDRTYNEEGIPLETHSSGLSLPPHSMEGGIIRGLKTPQQEPGLPALDQGKVLVRLGQLRAALQASVNFDRFYRAVQVGMVEYDDSSRLVLKALYEQYRDLTVDALQMESWNEYALPSYVVDEQGRVGIVDDPDAVEVEVVPDAG